MQFVKGPIFANVILADEINRTPPKTQAALLEAMQEHQVTAAGVRYPIRGYVDVAADRHDALGRLGCVEGLNDMARHRGKVGRLARKLSPSWARMMVRRPALRAFSAP